MANDGGSLSLRAWAGVALNLFGRNWITLFGAALTTASAILTIVFVPFVMLADPASPYAGIIAFMLLPPVFIGGLVIIPLGALWGKRKNLRNEDGSVALPVLNFNDPATLRSVMLIGVLTFFNLLIISSVGYGGYQFMDSVTFCGKTCHTVMTPEYTAHQASPHARVACVQCHIGPGASWFVKSKLSGARQVIATLTGSFHQPIPTPVENLRPSQDTCEQCHWPERFTGDRMKIVTKYQEDEKNTPKTSVLVLHIGGGGKESGIHSWHVAPGRETTYLAADKGRQTMARVRVRTADGKVTEFKRDGVEVPAGTEERRMDCIDCHNRPTHIYRNAPDSLDLELDAKTIDPTLPFIKKVGVEALTGVQAKDADADLKSIEEHVRSFYEKEQPEVFKERKADIDKAIDRMKAIYNRNVFPVEKVGWNTYINNLGHVNFPGCFRCHDDSMHSEDGKTIPQDCNTCHAMLAWDEENPEILKTLRPE